MNIKGDDAEKVADAVANLTNELQGHPSVASSGVRTSLPLIAAMIPLVGIMAGIWFNFASESRARESEKESRQREEEIRVMELAVPVYRNLAVESAALDHTLDRCEAAINHWWTTDADSEEERAAQTEIDGVCIEEIELAYSKLSAALEEAKLVSNEDLIIPVEVFQASWDELRWAQGEYATSKFECIDDETGVDACLDSYVEARAYLAEVRFCVFEEIRQNVLLQGDRSGAEVSDFCAGLAPS